MKPTPACLANEKHVSYRAPTVKDRTAGKPSKPVKVKANEIKMTLWGE